MMLFRISIPRRRFLRAAGVTVALPFLDAMVPAVSRAATTPARRLSFVYIPNGVVMDKWTPATEGPGFELSPTLAPLQPFRDQVLVLSGLGHNQGNGLGDGGGDHSRATSTWLNGVHPKKTEGSDIQGGTTADQIAAREFGRFTQLASLELGIDSNHLVGNCENGYSCVYMNTISWRTPTTPNPPENNPRVVFERLFGEGGTTAQRMAQMRKDRSIIDSVTEEIASLQKTLGLGDRSIVSDYMDSVRDVERRIQKTEEQSARIAEPDLQRPVGIPETFDGHMDLMFDLQVLAFQADITRVTTFMVGRELSQRTYAQIGVPDPHHTTSHHQNHPAQIAKLEKIDIYHAKKFAQYLEKLKSTQDGDGNLLDHSAIVYGGGIGDGNLHNHIPLPVLVAGGGSGQIRAGRHLMYKEGTPVANLLLSLLDKAGIPADRLGDSTGRLDREPLGGF